MTEPKNRTHADGGYTEYQGKTVVSKSDLRRVRGGKWDGCYVKEEHLVERGFIENPIEEVKGDWIREMFIKCKMGDGGRESIDAFRTQLNKYMPKPVEQITNTTLDEVVDRVEILMQYRNPEREQNKNYLRNVLKSLHSPVEQELIPLDVDKVYLEIYQKMYGTGLKLDNTRETFICEILSKYGVHKQEEIGIYRNCDMGREDGKSCCSHCKGVMDISRHYCTPTPQATSVIDVEEVVEDMCRCVFRGRDGKPVGGNLTYDKGRIKKILSSLPIVQKKRTHYDLQRYAISTVQDRSSGEAIIKVIKDFLKKEKCFDATNDKMSMAELMGKYPGQD